MTRRSPTAGCLVLIAAALVAAAGCQRSTTQPGPIAPPVNPTPTPAPTPEPVPPSPRLGVTRILAFGDSMTEGTTSPSLPTFALDAGRAESYPFKLQALIAARYRDQAIQVVNGGLAGRRAAEDRERFSRWMSDAQPEVILLLEGANDLNAPWAQDEGVNDRIRFTVGSLEDLVKDATYRQVRILVGTLPPQRPGGPKAGASDFLTRFNDAVKVMAAAKGGESIDISAGLTLGDIGQDGLHPTEEGYQRMAEIWMMALRERYEMPPAPSAAAAK